MTDAIQPPQKLVLITGPSGAGLSTASAALEDAGFEAIDNLPLRFVTPLLEQPESNPLMSLGIDTRNRDFSTHALLNLIEEVSSSTQWDVQLLYLDCRADVILRRYSSTKRRHPFQKSPSLTDAVQREIELLAPLRARADVLIDTSELNPHQLREEVETWFAPDGPRKAAVQVQSFSYKRGLPRGADMVFDCRFLQNPYWEPALRALDGRNDAVANYVSSDKRFSEFFDMVENFARFMLPATQGEGKSYLSIAFGCTGGQHRSVALAERLAATLEASGRQVSIRHRELDRRAGEEEASQ
jgi:UPF0042 nucleotide-binding protein